MGVVEQARLGPDNPPNPPKPPAGFKNLNSELSRPIFIIMPSETDVAPKAISGTGWDWVGNLRAGLC